MAYITIGVSVDWCSQPRWRSIAFTSRAGHHGSVAQKMHEQFYFLSKYVNVLQIVRHGLPGSMNTTYQINPPLD